MKSLNVLRLGESYVDRASGVEGVLTHWFCNLDFIVNYLFQPKGLNESGQPHEKIVICAGRLVHSDKHLEKVDAPLNVLGTLATEKISGFTGMVVGLDKHLNGCVHLTIQPKGLLPGKTGIVEDANFDIRGCEGEAIPVLTKEEQRVSEEKHPSPCEGSCKMRPPKVS